MVRIRPEVAGQFLSTCPDVVRDPVLLDYLDNEAPGIDGPWCTYDYTSISHSRFGNIGRLLLEMNYENLPRFTGTELITGDSHG